MNQQILIFALMFAVMYFLIIRPQKQQQKRLQQLISELKVGDKVMMQGGVVGEVTALSDTKVTVKTGDSKIEYMRSSVAGLIPEDSES